MEKFIKLVEQIAWDIKHPINEDSYDKLVRKQSSISSLFPGKFPGRVSAVKGNGGVKLGTIEPDRWSFTIASGTVPGKKYDAVVNFSNLMDIVTTLAQEKKYWTKDESRIDLRKIAGAVFEDTNLQIYCSCPSDLYYGFHYIRTKRDSKYTEPETRRPKIRNPGEHGAYCKHLQVLMDSLKFYISTLAHFLKKFYSKQILEIEKLIKDQRNRVTKGAEVLKQKEIQKSSNVKGTSAAGGGRFTRGSVNKEKQ